LNSPSRLPEGEKEGIVSSAGGKLMMASLLGSKRTSQLTSGFKRSLMVFSVLLATGL